MAKRSEVPGNAMCNPEIDCRGALECMLWAGTGMLWTPAGGVAGSMSISDARAADAAAGGFTFLQMSDSHIGFNKPANPDALGTLREAVAGIKAMAAKPAGVRVTLQLGTAVQAIELLRSHRAELGFVAGGAVAAPEIETEPLLEYEVVIVGKSALVPQRPTHDSLEKLTWISREEGSATRISSDAGLARLGIVPRHRLELPSNEALVYALKRGYGIAAISRYVVAAELRTGLLAVIHVRGWNVRNVVSVLRLRDAKLTPSADRFQAFVRARLGEMARRRARRQT